MSITLNFLGRDSGFGEQNNSAYYIDGDELIIIDCGYTVFNIIKKKFDLKEYSKITVIITHLHNDHAGSLGQLILYSWFVYHKKVNIVSNCLKIKEYLDITGTPKDAYDLLEDYKEIEFIKTEHVEHLDSYGFKISLGGKKILYTGDTRILDPFLPYVKEIDEFYIDVSRYGGAHIKFDDVVDKLFELKNMGIEIILMHMDDRRYIESILSEKGIDNLI